MDKLITNSYAQQIGNNLEEKLGFWREYLSQDVKNRNILEVGIGGGQTLAAIVKLCAVETAVHAIDTEEQFVTFGRKVIGANAIKGNVCAMPYPDSFFDAINVSSLVHEISTFGYKDSIGLPAIRLGVSELIRVLKPGGFLLYRDVLAPVERERKVVSYKTSSIVFFIDLFLNDFLNSPPQLYQLETDAIRRMGETLTITAENFLHREIQKHFLLCLEDLGQDLDTGDHTNSQPLTKERFTLLEKVFSTLIVEDRLRIEKLVQKWLQREGKEKYLYLTVTEFIALVQDVAEEKTGTPITIVTNTTERRPLRNEHNAFLRTIIANPEEEGKQVFLMRK